MAVEIFRVFGSMFLDGADETEKQLQDIDKQGEKTGGTLGKMGSVIAKGAKVAGVGILAAGTTLTVMAKKGADATDRIDKLSQKMGLSRKAFQEWDFIASQSGASVEDLQGGLAALAEKMDDAKTGAGEASELFDRLGIDPNVLKTQEEGFEAVVIALQGMENGAEKAAIASKLLGGTGEELMPLLNQQAGSIEELKSKANDLGLVMSDTAINAGVQLTDSLDQVTSSIEASATSIIAELMPSFTDILDWVTEHMPEIQSGIEKAIDVGKTVFEELSDIIETLTDNADILIPALSGVVAGIVAFQIVDKVNKLMALWTTITQGQTVAQGLLNAVMNANPIGLVVIAIGALVAAGVLLWRNWDTVSAKAEELWGKLKETFDNVKEWVIGVWDSIVDSIKGSIALIKIAVGGLVNVMKVPINGIIGLINKFITRANRIKIPNWVPGFGGRGINIPKIPLLAKGGNVIGNGSFISGEFAPEMVTVSGNRTTVTPLSDSQKARSLNNGNNGPTIIIQSMTVKDGEGFVAEIDKAFRNRRLRGAF